MCECERLAYFRDRNFWTGGLLCLLGSCLLSELSPSAYFAKAGGRILGVVDQISAPNGAMKINPFFLDEEFRS